MTCAAFAILAVPPAPEFKFIRDQRHDREAFTHRQARIRVSVWTRHRIAGRNGAGDLVHRIFFVKEIFDCVCIRARTAVEPPATIVCTLTFAWTLRINVPYVETNPRFQAVQFASV